MAHASRGCPYCGERFISMSSDKLAQKRRDSHVERDHMLHPDIDRV
ncbi:hypothetical protein M1M34_gp076 [Haloarcula tailed virus 2]|uniref:Uncharacterized protein n=1 Tax=Haloarcula tailed virus 2 TaxID=2877989 RepID=A0AAE8XZY8_9CAUD|nr:hypothetical protein M1M34_gp076 [Haloarcula tailed virus 2]UBF23257.1 hypothetical protein HATV-2_gp106 [Haloarcula tailed virus 2]